MIMHDFLEHKSILCPVALSYGLSQHFTSVVRCVQGQTLARCVEEPLVSTMSTISTKNTTSEL